MELIIAWLVENFGKFGVLFFIGIFLLIKYDNKFLAKIYNYFNKQIKPIDVLKIKLAYWTNFKIDSIHFDDKGRELIFKDLLLIRFSIILETVETVENMEGFSKFNNQELYTEFVDCIFSINKVFAEKCITKGIPIIVLEKYTEWTKKTMEYLLITAQMISNSTIYNNNYEKIQAIYMLITSLLEITIAEAERSLEDLNGELSGIEYKGYTCV